MKIEVGKTYVDREGAHVQITKPNPDPYPDFRRQYPWVGLDADGAESTFTEDGRFDRDDEVSPYDLVAEAPAATDEPVPYVPTDLGRSPLPQDSAARQRIPLVTGVLDYFPAALAAVATHSLESNEKHNPGEPMHWARGKSMDHPDCILRHLVDARAALDPRYHLTALAWRALALLQEELEGHGAPVPPGAR